MPIQGILTVPLGWVVPAVIKFNTFIAPVRVWQKFINYAYAPLPMSFSGEHGLSMSNNALIMHPITCVLLPVNRA